MRIVLLGINHRTAPVELRERLALPEDDLAAVYAELGRRYPNAERVILSTCNRIEIYVTRPTDAPPGAMDLRRFLAERSGVSEDQITAASIHREQEQAVQHLFQVCCGLDSMVLGEPQILGQVKRAYEAATAQGAVGPVLHRVFQQAIASAKHIRTTTGIGAGRVSVGSVAVDFARQVFEDFSDKTIVGIGAGEMAKATLHHLMDLSPRQLWLTNRSPERAEALAASLGLTSPRGGARHWAELDELLVAADVVITSTAAREPILTDAMFRPLLRRRRHRPLFILDLAVPRDVESAVGAMSNVYLYNIDDLQTVIAATVDQRRDHATNCEAHLAEAVRACMHQIRHRDVGQLIHQLRTRLYDIGQAEQQRTRRKLAGLTNGSPHTDEVDALIAEHTHRLINKILHLPLSQLDDRRPPSAPTPAPGSSPGSAHGDVPLGFYAAALRRLFDLEDKAPADEAASPPAKKSQSSV